MKVLVVLVSVVACAAAQNVVCGKGSSTNKEVTVEDKKTYTFKTQTGKKYKGNTECTVKYKMGDSCAKMSFVCTKGNIHNKDRKKCMKGDKLTVTANGKTKAYCGKYSKKKQVKVSSAGDMSVVFTSDKKKHSTGAVCKVKCTEAAGSTTGGTSSSDCKCGLAKRKSRIVGGVVTEVNEYPWQVGIVDKGYTQVWCGASLISDRWILTAAHCTRGESAGDIQALLGEHDYSSNKETNMVRVGIAEIINHPDYHHQTTNIDFSLLKMKKTIDFSKYSHIRPICLPTDTSKDYTDFTATVSGWGTLSSGGSSSKKLREVDVKVLSNSDCKNKYSYPSSWITSQMLCANVDGGGKDACQGDSGGPLVTAGSGNGVTAGQNYELIGVVSWGSGCASASYPGVYSRVTMQLDWITATTGAGWNTCPRE